MSPKAQPSKPRAPRAKKSEPKPKRELARAKPEAASTAPSAPPPQAPSAPRAERRDPADTRLRAAEERLALRLAVLEDVVRRGSHDTRTQLTQLGTQHGELARRLADVEKRVSGHAP